MSVAFAFNDRLCRLFFMLTIKKKGNYNYDFSIFFEYGGLNEHLAA